ncbi:N4-gp56 family major capsid protein [Pseudescherichia sp.]|uniref:N4-gp56 family major capsid protein n=1 Tax=Pseudescherichia sp. TaxID=2055881 RepID=UPI0028ADBDCB|nr:N4-gp56 family major capsid protein [Pseudescherichia sp.]
MTIQYKDPVNGTASSVGPQIRTDYWYKKAIIDAVKEQYFTPLADVVDMPKNMGKTIKVYQYVPLLDDRNVNDQGIDASGATISNGNLWGSSKDIGNMTGKLPTLTENGGRVNRVGFTRITREGTIHKMGFFTEFTQESLDFDTDDELFGHYSREMVNGAGQMTEAILQYDLLNGAGVIVYGGEATSNATITGEGTAVSAVSYDDLMRLSLTLDDNRAPKHTKIIAGSRMVDTKTINSARVLYIGSELVPLLRKMKDSFGDPAFIPVNQYADAGTLLNGEIGTIDRFRIVLVPEMYHWAGVGATATDANLGYRETGDKYDVYPMLAVASESFTTIGFQTDGKSVKFNIQTKMPGKDMVTVQDPYGETGLMSIKWYYGTLIKRPEWIALVKTVAPV